MNVGQVSQPAVIEGGASDDFPETLSKVAASDRESQAVARAARGRLLLANTPIALARENPLGSLVFSVGQTADFQAPGETDTYDFPLQAGDNVTLVLTPSGNVQAALRLSKPGGGTASLSASVPGQTLVLQNEPAATGGTCTLEASSLDGSGSYTIDVLVNAGQETEALGGAANDRPEDAQDIGGSALGLPGGADRLAVRGTAGPEGDYYRFALEDGQPASILLEGPDYWGPWFQVRDGGGALLTGSQWGGTDADAAVPQFTAPQAGDYLVRVLGAELYLLTVTRGAVFPLEPDTGPYGFVTSLSATASNAIGHLDDLGDGADEFHFQAEQDASLALSVTAMRGDLRPE